MQIRKAHPEDLPQLTDILNQSIRWGKATAFLDELKTKHRNEWFSKHSQNPCRIFVAEDQQTILGYLSLGIYREGREAFRHVAEVSYFVHFDYHKKGVAGTLMEHALNYCRKVNIDTLLAFLYANNEPSILFLKKFGFERWGLFPSLIRRDNSEIDHVIYGLRITN